MGLLLVLDRELERERSRSLFFGRGRGVAESMVAISGLVERGLGVSFSSVIGMLAYLELGVVGNARPHSPAGEGVDVVNDAVDGVDGPDPE